MVAENLPRGVPPPADDASRVVAVKSPPAATPPAAARPAVAKGSDWPAPLAPKKDASHGRKDAPKDRKQLSDMDQDRLEELCRDLVKKALLSSPEYQLSIGLLGTMPEISSILQQMPSRRRKLSKILREQPGNFVLFGTQFAEPIVSLSQQALAFARLEETSKLASDSPSTAVSQDASMQEGHVAIPKDPVVDSSKTTQCTAGHEESCNMLVEMGFDREKAMRALRANNGDIFEAMDQLSTVTQPMIDCADKEQKQNSRPKSKKNAGVATAEAKPMAQPDEPNERHKKDKPSQMEAPDSEEDMLERILALSQKEEDERKRRQQLDEEALKVALASSLLGSTDSLGADGEDEDEQLREALEQSKRMEEDRQRQEQREMEDIEQAEQESMRNYELFHLHGDDDFERTLRQSLANSDFQDAHSDNDEEGLRRAIQSSYNQASNGSFDDTVVGAGQLHEAATGSESACITTGADASDASLPRNLAADLACDSSPASSTPPPCQEAQGSTATVVLAYPAACPVDDVDGQHVAAGIQGRAVSPPQGPSSLSIRDWFFRRKEELQVDFDSDVMWMALNEIEADQLHDQEVLKMWLGFPQEEKLPSPILSLLSEFREQQDLRGYCMN